MAIFHIYIRAKHADNSTFEVATDRLWTDIADVSFDEQKLKDGIFKLHQRGSEGLLSVPDQTPICSAIGEELFKDFFMQSANVFRSYEDYRRNQKQIRIALHLAPSLYKLPWEVLRDPRASEGNFLALSGGSIVRYDLNLIEKDFEPTLPPFKIWLVYSNPSDRNFGGDTDIVPPRDKNIRFEQITPATFENFQNVVSIPSKKLSKGNINPVAFAFFGHGDLDTEQKIGRLIFVKKGPRGGFRIRHPWVTDPRPGYAVQDVLGVSPDLRLAFLCACESAWAGSEAEFSKSITGSLLRGIGSLGYVIGAQTPIDLSAADAFLSRLLSLLRAMPLDLAVSQARVAVRGMDYTEAGQKFSPLDWWVPVLYSRASSFDLLLKAEDLALQAPPAAPHPLAVGLDHAMNEPTNTQAMGLELKRKLVSLFGIEQDATRVVFDE